MTRSVILACEMIEDEVRLALEAVPQAERPPLVWVESGLHERPEKLRAALMGLIRVLDEGAGDGKPVHVPSARAVGTASHASLPPCGRLRLAAPQPRLRARADPEEPAPLLPDPWLVQP